jgi:hypothetical protein
MASDIEKAANRDKDVYELERLSYVYEGDSPKLQEIGIALQQIVPQLDPAKNRDELAYITKALDCPELDGARSAARAALGWPLEPSGSRLQDVPATSRSGDGGVKATRCPECGTQATEGATVCPYCGSSLAYTPATPHAPATWTCPACGGPARLEWDRCPQCGYRENLDPVAEEEKARRRAWEPTMYSWPGRHDPRRALIPLRAKRLRIAGLALYLLFFAMMTGGIVVSVTTGASLLIFLALIPLFAGLVLLLWAIKIAGIEVD